METLPPVKKTVNHSSPFLTSVFDLKRCASNPSSEISPTRETVGLQAGDENCGKRGSSFSMIQSATVGCPEKAKSLSQTPLKTDETNKENSLLGNQYEIRTPPPLQAWEIRVRKWALQSASQVILSNHFRTDKVARKQQVFRVCFCMKRIRQDRKLDLVKKDALHHYSGLMRCGSVWTCPLCASILSERRRLEIQTAVKNWQDLGGSVVMLTLTVPHTIKDTLPNVLKQFSLARRTQRKSKPFKKWAALNLHGSITALETTFGSNGWHVHTHEILFLTPAFLDTWNTYVKNNPTIYFAYRILKQHAYVNKKPLPKEPFLKILQDSLFLTWKTAAVTAGFKEPSELHGLDISDSDEVAGYASKWGVDLELTKTHLKNSRKNGRTPWAILNDFLDYGDIDDAQLFYQFARHFKGKNQLHWTKGLKKSLSITDLKDTEIIEDSEAGEVVFTLSLSQWRLVLASNNRAQLLETVNALGSQAVEPFLAELLNKKFEKIKKTRKPKKTKIKTK